ncbi:MAG: hypothetical protein M1827_007137 [Pycnora praestabilis]|nr:MAG: hypothetical protein M1827_007137 [Pycnora praestabilis]
MTMTKTMQGFQEDFNYSPDSLQWNGREQTVESEQPTSPTSPLAGLASPGLESVPDTETEKEAVIYPVQENIVPRRKKKTVCGIGRTWFFLALIFVICIAIALGIGLGVGLNKKSSRPASSSSARPINNSADINPAFYSTIGAFNGTGIALASESFSSGGYGSIDIYFQHHTGQIRSAQLLSDGTWQGGSLSEIVATDAKNATPIAAVAYARNDTATWHIFYIDINNTIQERVNDNATNLWSYGPIGDLNLKAMDSPEVGLQACWYGSFYSDAVYNHSPVPGQTNGTHNAPEQSVGMHLWYGETDTSFNEVAWTYGDTVWSEQQKFEGFNAHAGVGCYSWGPGSVSYVFMVNFQNSVEIWWKDLNTTLQSTTTHPINTWTNSSVTIPNVSQNTSVGYTNFLYAQREDLSISGFNVSWNAENTSIPPSQTLTVNGEKGLAGTHLSVTALPNDSGGNSLLVFYQTNGTDLKEFVRDLDQGQWTESSIPIPPN